MRKLGFLLALSITIACSACRSSRPVQSEVKARVVPKDKMEFSYNSSHSLTNIVDKAAASGKLIFVDIYTDWCTPCKLMDEDVFTDVDFTNYMKSNFVNYKVDGEKHNGPNLGVMFGVAGFPTLLILDQRGRLLERHDGALYQSGLREMAERALAKVN